MEVQLQSLHEHPLVLTDPRADHGSLRCKKCKWDVNRTSYYYCSQSHCKFAVHYQCSVALPQHINHPLHPHHPLTLAEGTDYHCQICSRTPYNYAYPPINEGSYTCMKCNFHLDIDCALLPTITSGKHIQVKPACHLKPMALVENYDDYNGVDGGVFECYVCQTPCGSGSSTSTSTFVCTICKRFIHDSCTELPLETKNPFHPPSCSLFFNVRPREKQSCDLFHRENITFFFRCDEHCQNRLITLCLACPFLRPTIKYRGHNHLLCLVEKFKNIPDRCKAYHFTHCQQSLLVSSNDELINCPTKSFILRCVLCDFNLHFLCGPLPCTIKNKCHIHPLTLRDSIVEDNSGEYYCDACETKRDPRLCVYYCAECKFIAHFDCVISEVVRALKGDFKDVEFRLVGQREQVTLNKFNSMSMTMKDIVMNASGSEPLLYGSWKIPIKLITKGKQAQIVKNSMEFYTDENFAELDRRLHDSSSLGMFGDDVSLEDLKTLEIVNVEGYMISWNYADMLKDLIDKHGDIGSASCLTIEGKSLTYFTLCRVINSMRTTLLVDVTEDLLQGWYACLNNIEQYGFKIDFIYARLEQVVHAYYGLQASRAENEMEAQIDQEIEDLQHQVVQLLQQIQNVEAKLESCKEHRQDYRKQRSSKKCSDFMKECLSKASMLEWEAVGEDLV